MSAIENYVYFYWLCNSWLAFQQKKSTQYTHTMEINSPLVGIVPPKFSSAVPPIFFNFFFLMVENFMHVFWSIFLVCENKSITMIFKNYIYIFILFFKFFKGVAGEAGPPVAHFCLIRHNAQFSFQAFFLVCDTAFRKKRGTVVQTGRADYQ